MATAGGAPREGLNVGVSPYVADLRREIGGRLLLLPSVTVLVRGDGGRLLLVRTAASQLWDTVGGMVEPDEDPRDSAMREAREEAGVTVVIDGIRAVLGGPQFRLRYANGDEAAYVITVFDAHVVDGAPCPDGVETIEVRWVDVEALGEVELSPFASAQFEALGMI